MSKYLVTARQLAKLGVLNGLNGKVITNPNYVRKFIASPGRFKTYRYPIETKFSKKSHMIDIREVYEWNQKINQGLKAQADVLNSIK